MTIHAGVIATWNDDRGYGFIEPEGGGKVFLHIRDFSRRHRRPRAGLAVRFELSADSRGRPRAVRVQPREGYRRTSRAGRQVRMAGALCLGFYAGIGSLVLMGELPLLVPAWYALFGLVTFALYAKDKAAARSARWRTPENTLHLLSLAGGWTGALVARQLFRHKTSKVSFRVIFWLTVAANLLALGWLLSPSGSALLDQLWMLSREVEHYLW
ncbi:DUF1294 domain-containing protein [Microbulbifer yueqingensis]|uniref:Uncharacterized membrane protein YsdA, DUF1294 family n=1 Tax=Microbulbifer yueqingensis TaxID=658219 RepID=A0A1G8X2Q5_9GAMM|nr:DUF1294 domain-containing protein [Microbulbifer yueqingensis]SDJ84803.1 Uncharacterized membrane protein YsdA, DUF1294 family [Microbulbifer yueqingensis]